MALLSIDRHRRALAAVSANLRHPVLWFPVSATNKPTLAFGRVPTSAPTMVVKGVRTSRRHVPGRDGVRTGGGDRLRAGRPTTDQRRRDLDPRGRHRHGPSPPGP